MSRPLSGLLKSAPPPLPQLLSSDVQQKRAAITSLLSLATGSSSHYLVENLDSLIEIVRRGCFNVMLLKHAAEPSEKAVIRGSIKVLTVLLDQFGATQEVAPFARFLPTLITNLEFCKIDALLFFKKFIDKTGNIKRLVTALVEHGLQASENTLIELPSIVDHIASMENNEKEGLSSDNLQLVLTPLIASTINCLEATSSRVANAAKVILKRLYENKSGKLFKKLLAHLEPKLQKLFTEATEIAIPTIHGHQPKRSSFSLDPSWRPKSLKLSASELEKLRSIKASGAGGRAQEMTYLMEKVSAVDESMETAVLDEKVEFLSVAQNGLIFGVMPTQIVDALYSREPKLKSSGLEKVEEIIKIYCHSKSSGSQNFQKIEGIYVPQLFHFLCKLLRAFRSGLALRVVRMLSAIVEHDSQISYRVNLKTVLVPLLQKLKDSELQNAARKLIITLIVRNMVRPLVALKTLSRFLAKSPATSVLELVLVVILAAKSPFRSAKESPYIGGINLLLLAKDIARLYIKVANPLRSTALECIALVAHRVGKEKLQEVMEKTLKGFADGLAEVERRLALTNFTELVPHIETQHADKSFTLNIPLLEKPHYRRVHLLSRGRNQRSEEKLGQRKERSEGSVAAQKRRVVVSKKPLGRDISTATLNLVNSHTPTAVRKPALKLEEGEYYSLKNTVINAESPVNKSSSKLALLKQKIEAHHSGRGKRIKQTPSLSPPRIQATATNLRQEKPNRNQFAKLKMSFPGRNTPAPRRKDSSNQRRALETKVVGRSLAVQRNKLQISEIEPSLPKVVLNNFYSKSPNLKLNSELLGLSPAGRFKDFSVAKQPAGLTDLRSARSSKTIPKLEEPEEEQMAANEAKPVKRLPIIKISSQEEAQAKFQDCRKVLLESKNQTLVEREWTKQNDSCIALRSLCIQSEDVLKNDQQTIVQEILPLLADLMRSPRSVLAKSAITTVAFLVRALTGALDAQILIVENILHTLFLKVADKIKFLSHAAEQALKIVVGNLPNPRVFSYIQSFQHGSKPVDSRWAVALAVRLIIEKQRKAFFELKCAQQLLKMVVELTSDPAKRVRDEGKQGLMELSRSYKEALPEELRTRLNESDYKRAKKILTGIDTTLSRSQMLGFSISRGSFLTQTGGAFTGRSKSASGVRTSQEAEDMKIATLTQQALKKQHPTPPLRKPDVPVVHYSEKVEADLVKLSQNAAQTQDWRKRMLFYKKLTQKITKNGGLYHRLPKQGPTKAALFDAYLSGIRQTNINVIQGVFDYFLHIAFLLRVSGWLIAA